MAQLEAEQANDKKSVEMAALNTKVSQIQQVVTDITKATANLEAAATREAAGVSYATSVDEVTGELTGKNILKKEAHKKGVWHGAIHIWIISSDKKRILLQKRCADKDLFPNMWDISVGGHISSGEDSLLGAKRELSEELGLNPSDYEIEFIEGEIEEQTSHSIADSGLSVSHLLHIQLILC